MDRLRSTTFLSTLTGASLTLALLAPQAARADTTVSTSTTAPLKTSTAGNVTVASGGTITLASGGTAVTVDSNNTATVASGGTITNTGGKDADTGITIEAGRNTTVTNGGTITVTESFNGADTDSNGIVDGPIASASNRYGILVAAGATTTATIKNTGTITVEGLNSGGMVAKSDLTGSISNTGTIKVIGDNSVGIGTKGVSGNVAVEGTVAVVGAGAQGLVVGGDVGGSVRIQGAISQSSSYTNDAGTTKTLSRTDLRTGKAAVEIGGSVAGGILLDAAPYDLSSSSTDEDNDGVTDSSEVTGSITSVGNSPALLVGAANDIVIGKVKGRDGEFSLAIDGGISASSVYSNTDAYAVVIGGKGGAVSMANGIGVSGTITATSVDQKAVGILINEGSTVPTLSNSGTIKAVLSSPGEGAAYAIQDKSGTLTTLNNTGFIAATGSTSDDLRAIDLSANTSGVTIKQYLNDIDKAAQVTEQAASGYNSANPVIYTSITGNIHTGSGNDVLDVASGRIYGNSFLGAGNDSVLLSGDSGYVGNIDFGTGTATMAMSGSAFFVGKLDLGGNAGTLTLGGTSIFAGTLANSGALDVTVNGGKFGASSATTLAFDSLTVNSGGALNVYIDGTTGTASRINVNSATFASGSKVTATISSLDKVVGNYTILSAGTLTGSPVFDATNTKLPVLFNGAINRIGETLVLAVTRKTATQLGLSAPLTAAFDALYAQGTEFSDLGSSFLQVDDETALQGQFNQLLPDYAGGVFDFVTRSGRLGSRHLMDDSSIFDISDVGGWFEPIYFRGTKDQTGTAAFKVKGWGLSAGLERDIGAGYVGASFLYTKGDIATSDYQKTDASNYELGLFWRLASGPFYAYAKASGGRVSLNSTRQFTGALNSATLSYTATGNWKGWTVGGQGGVSYKAKLGGGLSLKPMAKFDYYRLSEKGFTESGDEEIALTVAKRTSDLLTGTGSLTAAWSAGEVSRDERPLTLELEGGYRSRLAGKLGDTVANFTDGDQFRLTADRMKSGWTAEARVLAGGMDYTWQLAGGAEQIQGGVDYSIRAGLSVAF
jgi:hypothetical protein